MNKRQALPQRRIKLLLEGISDKSYLTQKERRRVSSLYDASIRDRNLSFRHFTEIGRWEGPPAWTLRKNWTRPNYFFWSYWAMQGKIEQDWTRSAREAVTFGGSCWDGFLGLKKFDREDIPVDAPSESTFQKFLGFIGLQGVKLKPMSPKEYPQRVDTKPFANPGPTFILNGIRTKGEAYKVCMVLLEAVLAGELLTSDLPPVLYGVGGRGKPTTIDKVKEKIEGAEQVGRAVWMADAHEATFSWRYQRPLTDFLAGIQGVIDVGGASKGSDRAKMFSDIFDTKGFFVSSDWKSFDASVQGDLIRLAFKVIRVVFSVRQGDIDCQILGWLEQNFIHSIAVCPDRVMRQKHTGVPSGSGLTFLIDSIVNSYVIWVLSNEWEKKWGGAKGSLKNLKVCGDDNLQGFKLEGSFKKCFRIGKEYAEFFQQRAKLLFGMDLHLDKTRLSVDPAVKYSTPIIRERVDDHSREYMRIHPAYKYVRGRPVLRTGHERYWYIRDVEDLWITTSLRAKRFSYSFSGAVTYCSNSYLRDGTPIRPKPTVVARLACTSSAVKNVKDWRALILQYLVEFWSNVSARGELLSMWLDSFYMERLGIVDESHAIENIHDLESGFKSYPARDYIMSHPGRRTKETTLDGRGWWLARADWWPELKDGRFAWLREYISSMHELVARVHRSNVIESVDLFRIREMVLTRSRGSSVRFSGEKERRISRFLEVMRKAAGYTGELLIKPYDQWFVESSHRALAHIIVRVHCGREILFGTIPFAPLSLEVPMKVLSLSPSGRPLYKRRRLAFTLG